MASKKKKVVKKDISKNEEFTNKKLGRKQDKQVKGIIWFMVIVLGILVLVLLANSLSNKFTYKGIRFEKNRYGEIILYSAEVPVVNYLGEVVAYINADFRKDPRTLKDIHLETGEIRFLRDSITYLSVDPKIEECEDSGIAIINLGRFIKSSGLNLKLSSLDAEHAERENLEHVTCENSPNNTVIVVEQGIDNFLYKKTDNCYIIEFKDCDVISVTERFELAILEQHVAEI